VPGAVPTKVAVSLVPEMRPVDVLLLTTDQATGTLDVIPLKVRVSEIPVPTSAWAATTLGGTEGVGTVNTRVWLRAKPYWPFWYCAGPSDSTST